MGCRWLGRQLFAGNWFWQLTTVPTGWPLETVLDALVHLTGYNPAQCAQASLTQRLRELWAAWESELVRHRTDRTWRLSPEWEARLRARCSELAGQLALAEENAMLCPKGCTWLCQLSTVPGGWSLQDVMDTFSHLACDNSDHADVERGFAAVKARLVELWAKGHLAGKEETFEARLLLAELLQERYKAHVAGQEIYEALLAELLLVYGRSEVSRSPGLCLLLLGVGSCARGSDSVAFA